LGESCRDLVQRCEKVKEEVYRHLSAIENVRSGVFQTLYTIVAIAVGTIFAVIAGIASILLLPLQDDYSIIYMRYILMVLIFAVVFAMSYGFIILINREMRKIRALIKKSSNLHYNSFVHYLNVLRNRCCSELRSACPSEEPLYCYDLPDLEGIANGTWK